MISASKYQHIIYFMSLLKASLCINRPKQRLLCMDTLRGCRSKRLPTYWKNKNFLYFVVWGAFLLLSFHGEGFMLRFSSYEGLFSSYGGLFATFSLGGGGCLFATSSSWCGAFFTMWGPFLLFFFFHVGGLFCLHGGFYVFMDFLWACPFPLWFILPAYAIM